MTPSHISHLPLGVIKANFGAGRCIIMVDQFMPIVDDSLRNLIAKLSSQDKKKEYIIAVLADSDHVIHNSTYTLNSDKSIVSAYAKFSEADSAFLDLVKLHTKTSPTKGLQF